MSKPRKWSSSRQQIWAWKGFVFASTYSNYGLSEDGKPVTEESPLNPQSLYAETKIASEEFLLSQKDSACAPLLFRFATLYGISPRTRFDLIVNQFVLGCIHKTRTHYLSARIFALVRAYP